MSHSKPCAMKIRLMKKLNQNRRVPAWVMLRTNRTFLRHPKREISRLHHPVEEDEDRSLHTEGQPCHH